MQGGNRSGQPDKSYNIYRSSERAYCCQAFDTRQNENVTFTVNAVKLTTPDTGAAIVKDIIPGLKAITATQPIPPAAPSRGNRYKYTPPAQPPGAKQLADNIIARQNEIIQSTNAVLHSVQSAAIVMGCLSTYELPIVGAAYVSAYKVTPADKPPPDYSCSQGQMIPRSDFPNQMAAAFDLVRPQHRFLYGPWTWPTSIP
jgi:hypothetical protein